VRATSLVVDASIALKWYLLDEPDRELALKIFGRGRKPGSISWRLAFGPWRS